MPMSILDSALNRAGPQQVNLSSLNPGLYVLVLRANVWPGSVGLQFNLTATVALEGLARFLSPWRECPRLGVYRSQIFPLIQNGSAAAFEVYEPMARSVVTRVYRVEPVGGPVIPVVDIPEGWNVDFYVLEET